MNIERFFHEYFLKFFFFYLYILLWICVLLIVIDLNVYFDLRLF